MTKIEWTDETWNPVTGCNPISEGCQNCYAKRMAQRLKGRFGYPADDPFQVTWQGDRWIPSKDCSVIVLPLIWKKPKRIFVCSMGDLFHEDVPEKWFFKVANIVGECPRHTFMFLTKRPDRVRDLGWETRWMSNIWLGITAENQQRWDERKFYLDIPAAKHFVSLEPLLAPVAINPFHGHFPDWVIVGGETGPRARPMHPEWVRSIRDQCQDAGVPFFFKSFGEWEDVSGGFTKRNPYKKHMIQDGKEFEKVGKKETGRLFDGQEWNEVPK